MTSSDFIDELERELRAAGGRRVRLVLARAPRVPAGAAAVVLALAISAAVVLPLLQARSRSPVSRSAAGGNRHARTSISTHHGRSVVVGCADTVSGQLARGWRSRGSGTVVAGAVAWLNLRGNANRAATTQSHFVEGLAVVEPGRGVTVTIPARERGSLSLDYTNVEPRARFYPSQGASSVTFKPCLGPVGQNQFDGGFIVSGPECAEVDIQPVGNDTRLRRFIPFGRSCAVGQPSSFKESPRRVLAGDRIGQASVGQDRRTVVRELDSLLGRPPTKPYYATSACRIDHGIEWPGLIVLFHRGSFVGYTYDPRHQSGNQPVLTTTDGLRAGDTVARGERLYGSAFQVNSAQGGNWAVNTPRGRIDGFTSDVTNPKGRIVTIEAGDVGCPAMTP